MKTSQGARLEAVRYRVDAGVRLPLVGTLDVQHRGRSVSSVLPRCNGAAVGRARRIFEVVGNDLLDEGLRSGDRLLVEARDAVPDGATVLVELDGRLTVKRIRRQENGAIAVVPANPALLPLLVRGERIRVRGVVVGLIRRRGLGRPVAPAPAARSHNGAGPEARAGRTRPRMRTSPPVDHRNGGGAAAVRYDGSSSGIAPAGGIRELGRILRALVATYGTLSNPRLRRALLDEAGRIRRRMRYVAAVRHIRGNTPLSRTGPR